MTIRLQALMGTNDPTTKDEYSQLKAIIHQLRVRY